MTKRKPPLEPNQCPSTRFSHDGETVFVTLQITRRRYEFCRWWARFHFGLINGRKHFIGTAEDQLEGYLGTAVQNALDSNPPADFLKQWPEPPRQPWVPGPDDDGIPF